MKTLLRDLVFTMSKREKFITSARGNIAVTFALSIVGLLAAAGAAIDASRWVAAQTDLQAAIDAATLAGTRAYSTNGNNLPAAVAIAQTYYTSQVQAASYEFGTNNVVFELNAKGNGISARGDVDMKTTFLGIIGIPQLPLIATAGGTVSMAEAGGGAQSLEVSLMLDVTGSMCDDHSGPCPTGTKISGAKSAANTLVDIVLSAAVNGAKSRIAVVPFNTAIRIEPDGLGGTMTKAMTNLNPTWSGYYQTCTTWSGTWTPGATSELPGSGNSTCTATVTQPATNWKVVPCVTERFFNSSWTFDTTDNAPGAGNWMDGADGSRAPLSSDSTDTVMTSGTGSSAADPTQAGTYNGSGSCYATDNANQVVPLTSSSSALHSAINGLMAYGGTSGVLGTAMAWYAISPNWASVWGVSAAPGPYSDMVPASAGASPKLRKIAVMMTDGAYNAYRSWLGQDMNVVSTNAISVCAAMKSQGIEIYTIGFDLGSLTAAEQTVATNTLQSCATDASHFFNSQDVTSLQTAFAKIGTLIAGNTHLSQ